MPYISMTSWWPLPLPVCRNRLLGYPLYTSAFAPENAVAFGDFKYYNIGDRGTRSFKQLTELFAGNGMIGYVAKERVRNQCQNSTLIDTVLCRA